MPEFDCKTAQDAGTCTMAECCGCLPFSAEFMEKRKESMRGVVTQILEVGGQQVHITADVHCVFLNRRSMDCMIYQDRHMICRNFGTVPALPCPYLDKDGNLRSEEDTELIKEDNAERVRSTLLTAADVEKFSKGVSGEKPDTVS